MKKTLKIIMLVVSFMIIFSIGTKIEAATASISASSSVTVGKSVTVTVKVNAATWNLKVSGSTSGTIVGFNMSGKNESTTKTFKFTPSKEGDYTVSLTGDITDANGKTSDINKKTTIKAKKASENDNSDDNKSTSGSNSNKSKSSLHEGILLPLNQFVSTSVIFLSLFVTHAYSTNSISHSPSIDSAMSFDFSFILLIK